MRRVMFTVAATVLLAGAVPATALAHHHHHRHHAQFRRFGDQNTAPTSMSASDNAGTVQSFQNGVLTIVLNDTNHTAIQGAVTNDTELECTSPEQSSTAHEEGDGGGGDQGSGDNNQGDNNQGDDNQGEDSNEDEQMNCSTANLVAGAVVHEASLRIGGAGAVWQKVELVS